MATTPGYAESLASGVVDIYAAVEAQLIALMAERVREGLRTDRIQALLTEVQAFHTQALAILTQATTSIQAGVTGAVSTAVAYGSASAANELVKQLNVPRSIMAPPRNVAALANQALNGVERAHFQILPKVTDVYSQVIREVLNAPLLGVETRQVAAQKALDEFASRGITVFSRGGRTWQISSYVEMSLRTHLMNAALQGHADQMEGMGQDLVVVSDHAQECKHCRPFEGKVLSLSGQRGVLEINGHKFTVEASLADAKRAGLFHPNCRHSFSAYQPGITRSFGETADPSGDADRQKLRYLERKVREWKRREAAAIDPEDKKAARAKAREWQSSIRDHVANTSARRQPDRERITGAFR